MESAELHLLDTVYNIERTVAHRSGIVDVFDKMAEEGSRNGR